MWFINFVKLTGHWINVQVEWVKSFLQEANGKSSIKALLGVIVISSFVMPYSKVSIKNGKLEDIPLNWVIMIAAILGLNILDYLTQGYIKKSVISDKEKETGINPLVEKIQTLPTLSQTTSTTEVKP